MDRAVGRLRAAGPADGAFLQAMALETVNWLPGREWSLERLLSTPDTAHYVEGWPRPTDLGVVAVDPADEPIGAAWLRFLTADDPGYGYVADDVPELGIAVVAEHRGRGVGRALLRELHERARSAGLSRISLSVEHVNPARRLYADEGYRTVSSEDDAADADTMLLELGQS